MKMENFVMNEVQQIFADIFNLSLESITSQSSPNTIAGWDSLQHVNLIVALEQKFNLQFIPEEIMQMLSIELIVSLIDEKLSQ